MKLISKLGNQYLKRRLRDIDEMKENPYKIQEDVFKELLKKGKNTAYGKKYGFSSIADINKFREKTPVVGYSDLTPFIERAVQGEKNVLWPGKMENFAKSSGTTDSRSKLIPVSMEGLRNCHYLGGRDMLAIYLRNFPDSLLLSGKNLSIGGSQEGNANSGKNTFYTGNISAIVMKNLPFWAQLGRTPGIKVALMNDWEKKMKTISEITSRQKITSLAGSPMWMLLLLQHIQKEREINDIKEVWPHLEVFFHGSVSFGPYKPLFEELDKAGTLRYQEIYNATEGFFGIQELVNDTSLLLMLNYGVFYEFIPEENFKDEFPETVLLSEVKPGKRYSLVISTNSGLWRYKIEDSIKFTSTDPFRFKIMGRTKHCINVFGEDLFAEQGEEALFKACKRTGALMQNFTVAPFFYSQEKKGYHEWVVEFKKSPANPEEFTAILDEELCKLNEDYMEKRKGDTAIHMPAVRQVPPGTFYQWLKSKEKLGGQHKIPAMSNSRNFVEEILQTAHRDLSNA
ncbi:GH3 auxin-responsive promoter family protein [Salegentibacter sp. F188]|uniref:GH3 auxin-responsive promoter family protein n=1 Tax=Autumnicola patrickiae TaxID=3075591 RepID=A0ABU3DWZ9_9FLAO|nr:GH3 auxin-responsive promoter family protein [Salegentibacter sp. F188]MDT0688253.1 GH3 auxin-responsive promoter family protein [Salegentibacter sp. F188]